MKYSINSSLKLWFTGCVCGFDQLMSLHRSCSFRLQTNIFRLFSSLNLFTNRPQQLYDHKFPGDFTDFGSILILVPFKFDSHLNKNSNITSFCTLCVCLFVSLEKNIRKISNKLCNGVTCYSCNSMPNNILHDENALGVTSKTHFACAVFSTSK